MRAGWCPELKRFYIVVYPEESGAGLGNMSYKASGGNKKTGIVILTKPRKPKLTEQHIALIEFFKLDNLLTAEGKADYERAKTGLEWI